MAFDDVLGDEMQKQPAAGAQVTPWHDQGETERHRNPQQEEPERSPRRHHAEFQGHNPQVLTVEESRRPRSHHRSRKQ